MNSLLVLQKDADVTLHATHLGMNQSNMLDAKQSLPNSLSTLHDSKSMYDRAILSAGSTDLTAEDNKSTIKPNVKTLEASLIVTTLTVHLRAMI